MTNPTNKLDFGAILLNRKTGEEPFRIDYLSHQQVVLLLGFKKQA